MRKQVNGIGKVIRESRMFDDFLAAINDEY